MNHDLKIFVPSSGRADRLITASQFSKETELIYVVPTEETGAYQRALDAAGYIGAKVLPFPLEGIRAKRQHILGLARNVYGASKIVMLDDDLRFRARVSTDPVKFQTATLDQVGAMLNSLSNSLDNYAHAGIVDSFMCQHNPIEPVESKRYNQVLAYNLSTMPEEVAFRLEVNEEHDVHLQLARRGLPPLVLTEYTKSSSYYSRGGCSKWRTAQVEREAHEQLAANFPEWVTVVDSKTSLSGKAIRVQWKKTRR